QAARRASAVAVSCGDERLSYGELNERANRLAHRLIRLGVGPESLVGLCFDRSLDLVIALLATLKAGGAYLPLDPEYPPARLHAMLSDAAPVVTLTTEILRAQLSASSLVIAIDSDRGFEGAPVHNPSDSERVRPLRAAHAAYVIYTSGSTGTP